MYGTKAAGLAEVTKAEEQLVAKSFQRRPARVAPSELDLFAMATLYLQSQGLSKKRAYREVQAAIARGGLNAPYTLGMGS